jgi:sugar phosphate isomerase/epimerase
MDECNDHRRPPGAGDFQVARFLSIVRGKTRSAPLTVEVTNFDRIAGDAQRAAAMLAEAFRRQLALAG